MSNRVLFSGVIAAGFALATLACGGARGADLSQYYSAQSDRVEFGSGWYIRGDLGATRASQIGVSDVPAFPNGSPQAPSLLLNSAKKLSYDASAGAGYRFNQWFRAELMGDYRQLRQASATGASKQCETGTYSLNTTPPSESGVYSNCTPALQSKLSSYDVLMNGYIDLGTWYGVTPYAGAGVGLSFGHYSTSSQWFQANNASYNVTYSDALSGGTYNQFWDRSSSGQYYNLAWALMAGFAIDIYDHTKLDIGYRYLNLGNINTSSGTLKLNQQEVRAGVRYMFDN